jgi:cytidyltransferase-like protein
MNKIVIVSGGFDPVHSGHVEYLKAAALLGDMLIVGINSDAWLVRKKGQAFMPIKERLAVVGAMSPVTFAVKFDDEDGSAKQLIKDARQRFPNNPIIFANGGDRTHTNIPEMDIEDDNLTFAFGVGGFNKANSSSWILQEWKAPKTERPWGYYRVLHEVPGMKVKELTVEPGKSLSMQRHQHRAEYWIVSEGTALVNSKMSSGYKLPSTTIEQHVEYRVSKNEWHQLTNPGTVPVKIVEIQYGNQCVEEDIERDE